MNRWKMQLEETDGGTVINTDNMGRDKFWEDTEIL